MAITLEDFKNIYNPLPLGAQILFYLTGSTGNEEVTAMNINTTDSENTNTFDSLNNLTSITLDLLDVPTTIVPLTKQFLTPPDFPAYFHFTFSAIDISGRISPTFPVDDISTGLTYEVNTFLVPSPADSDFFRSEYQAILNNTEEDRVTNFIYDVDRSNSSIVPLNYDTIISESAQKAAFQKLNHTSIGLRNSRYDGAKTSKTSFGVSPAIAGTTFEAASYLSSSLNSTICSQSLSDRNLDTFVFTGTDEVPLSGSSIFKFNNNQIVPVRNRRLWVRENEKVIYVNQQGEATSDGFSCIV